VDNGLDVVEEALGDLRRTAKLVTDHCDLLLEERKVGAYALVN
jgi:hypothetical protein